MKDFEQRDYDIVEKFVCDNTKFSYKTNTLMDHYILGNNMYQINMKYNAACRIQKWQNVYLRVNYFMSYAKNKGHFEGLKYR